MLHKLVGFCKKYRYKQFIFGIGLLVYFNMLRNDFVWEDLSLIIHNPMGHTFQIFSSDNSFNLEGQFRPVTALYSAIAYLFFQEYSFYYHLIQLLIHITNAILIFLFAKKLLRKDISLFLSILFVVHPINVEAVSYVGSFNSPLFLFFGLLALTVSTTDTIRSKRTIICLLLLSLFSKEAGILFLIIIPSYQYLLRRRYFIRSLKISTLTLGAYLLTKFVAGIQLMPRYPAPIDQLTTTQRLLTIPAVILYYIKTFFIPQQLAIYQRWVITSPTILNFYLPFVFDLLFFGLLILLGFYVYKKEKLLFPVYVFFLVWFMIGLLLHSQIIPLNLTVSDHWFYFPLVGLCGLIGSLIQVLYEEKRQLKIVGLLTAVIIISIFSVRTIVRNRDWRDNLTLFNHDSRVADNYILEDFVGSEYFYRKQYDKSLAHYYKSLQLYPREGGYLNIATVYKYSGNFGKAKEYYYKAIKNSKEDLLFSYQCLAALLIISDPEHAQELIKTALIKYPNDSELWADLALAEYTAGQNKKALETAEKAKSRDSSNRTEYVYQTISNNQKIYPNIILFSEKNLESFDLK